MTKYEIVYTPNFKRDFKQIQKRGYNLSFLKDIITKLANGEELPERNHDHALSGNYKGYRECHIKPDWLLIYKVEENALILYLTRTGTHSDLF